MAFGSARIASLGAFTDFARAGRPSKAIARCWLDGGQRFEIHINNDMRATIDAGKAIFADASAAAEVERWRRRRTPISRTSYRPMSTAESPVRQTLSTVTR
jgi:hypothetical protein